MPDPYRKVRPGEDLAVSAPTWNAMVDAAVAVRNDEFAGGARERSQARQGDLVRVKNETGADLPRNSVVGLSAPVFTPSDSVDAFLREVAFRGVVPTADHKGKFAILLEPAPAGRVVRGFVAGVCPVKVDVVSADHTCADAEAGETGQLVSADDGSAQILWREGEGGYSTGTQWAVVRFGANCSGSSKGSGTPGKCGCNDGPYTVDVDCGDCGPYGAYGGSYGAGTTMPKYWWLTIGRAVSTVYAYYDLCDSIPCEQLAGYRIRLKNEADGLGAGTCTWSGKSGSCVKAELTLVGDHWQLTVLDKADCVLAVLRKPVDDFNCCGSNGGWTLDPASSCDLSVSLDPDPCTCCPDKTCPPDGKPVCTETDCCLESCNCHLSVTVSNLATPTGTACTMFDTDCTRADGTPCNFSDGYPDCLSHRGTPPQSCGGMNGVYGFTWEKDCTWRFRGVPSGGTTKVVAEMTLLGEVWTLVLNGPDGQTAKFMTSGWACGQFVPLGFVGGTCPVLGPAPAASFNLCLNVN